MWRYACADFGHAQELLEAVDWDLLLLSTNVAVCWSNWQSKFLQIMGSCFPQAVIKACRNLPWLYKPIIQAMRKCNSLFCAARWSSDCSLWTKYKPVRNKVVAMLHWSKKQYFCSLRFANHKKFWKDIKLVNKQDSTILALHDDNTLITSPYSKANLLNNYFYRGFNHSFPSLSNPAPLDQSDSPVSLLCTEDIVRELLYLLNPIKF